MRRQRRDQAAQLRALDEVCDHEKGGGEDDCPCDPGERARQRPLAEPRDEVRRPITRAAGDQRREAGPRHRCPDFAEPQQRKAPS
jgi:hypothetical protein